MIKINVNGFYVYKLLDGDKIVYVGKSKNVFQRVFSHKADKVYDSVIIEEFITEGDMSLVEFKYIVKYKPTLNKSIPALPFCLRETRVVEVLRFLDDAGLNPSDHYDINNPDLVISLNGKVYNVWAKNGMEDEFNSKLWELIKECK